ncbi:MAG TPA: ester cyclase [Candidatus Limnocylindrales bacterium]|nr:ester cyclase [Candidatus Limnocylindrales bacterium]
MVVEPTDDAASPAVVVQRYLDEILDMGDLALLEPLISNEALRARVRTFRRAFPDLSVTTELLIAQGDLVAVHLQARGTHQAVFQGIPATGRTWTAGCTAIYRVERGRISDFRINWDLLGILEQVGGITRGAYASA